MRIVTLCIAILLVGCSSTQPFVTVAPKLKVLVITGGHGFKPEPFYKMFQDNPDITYTAAAQGKTAEAYDREDLLTYDVLVLYDAPQNITKAQKSRFLSLFKKGTGVIVLHHALLSYQSWPEFEQIAGAKYLLDVDRATTPPTPPSTYQGNTQIDVKVVRNDHPITRGIKDFTYSDEIYRGVRMSPDVTPLLTAEGKPLAWVRTQDKSRVVGIIIGHGPNSYTHPGFVKLLNQSIKWVGHRTG